MKQIKLRIFLLLIIFIITNSVAAAANNFDHSIWDGLLHKHVHMIRQGQASEVDYHAFLKNRNELRSYLSRLSAVAYSEFARWPQDERLAFLINAYNAYTVELILTRYPKLDSIKDLGSLFQSPWKKDFVSLLGKIRSLDDIEHGMIRKPGDYNEPRIHFTVNCASIGCPALLNEAFTGDKLEQQLETVTKAFLEDRTRNRYNASTDRLEVSKIFDWYAQDFESGWGGWHSLDMFFAHYADSLTDSEQARQVVMAGGVRARYLDYDWSLNDRK
ncbi:MAG TPA: DUF547 domain-containing protein [Nitrosomonas sp.]|nr:DUF547 domain-containing protein [Nitrosomonas sp.]